MFIVVVMVDFWRFCGFPAVFGMKMGPLVAAPGTISSVSSPPFGVLSHLWRSDAPFCVPVPYFQGTCTPKEV